MNNYQKEKEVGSNQTTEDKHVPLAGGLPWLFVATTAAGVFIFSNRDKLDEDGGFIIIIGAIILAVMSANMMTRE